MPSNRILIGTYPTPVRRLSGLGTPDVELWVKDDGQTHPLYGGNKVRKLERILARAKARGARRLVTVGAVGSHHVLATSLFGRREGFRVAAILFPQPSTEHVVETIRCSLGAGLEPFAVQSFPAAMARIATVLRPGDYFVPAGGSSVHGTLGYVDAVTELVDQVRTNTAVEPDVIVAPLGSAGTVAGLVVGAMREGLRSIVVGVKVVDSVIVRRPLVTALALRTARRAHASIDPLRTSRQLSIDSSELGRGYGWPTAASDAAERLGREVDLPLDPTYTAKAFARALRMVRGDCNFMENKRFTAASRPLCVLYWHTLSRAPLGPLLAGAPSEADLPASLRRLLIPS